MTSNKNRFLPTGFHDLDNLIQGLPSGELTVLASDTSIGKTTLALELALSAVRRNFPTCFFTPEMTESQIVKKSLARLAAENDEPPEVRVEHLFARNAVSKAGMAKLSSAAEQIVDLPLWINDQSAPSVQDIRDELQKVKSIQGALSLAVIDRIGLMHGKTFCCPKGRR